MRLDHDRVHIVGVGGAGMSALAKILSAQGRRVSGSDLRGGASLEALADLGVEVHAGHAPEVAVGAELVVASSAVPDYDEELTAAREAGVAVWRRPQLLDALTSGIETVGAAGTHGKTTTTALLIAALRSAGEDPSFIVGGELADLGTNGRLGSSPLLVVEADEAFRTFESINLDGLVITNVEPEHLDHFGAEEDLADSFASVARAVSGPVVACADDEGAATTARRAGAVTYGQSRLARWRVVDVTSAGWSSTFTLTGPGRRETVTIGQPGLHNVLNAAGALALLGEMGRDLAAVVPGVAAFRGVRRRWEHRGVVDGVMLVDDYAHHPTEVGAVLDAARGATGRRLWAVFQPHLYSRTERFSDEFGRVLAKADVVVVTDIFGAREAPVPGVTGELVADAARARGAETHYAPRRGDLAGFLSERVEPGDLVISMGAGDITLLHAELAAKLAVRP